MPPTAPAPPAVPKGVSLDLDVKKQTKGPVMTTIDEFYKVGPGPSSSHTSTAREFLSQITLVMGQRQQLVWDIPALDSFDLQRAIYAIPEAEFKKT